MNEKPGHSFLSLQFRYEVLLDIHFRVLEKAVEGLHRVHRVHVELLEREQSGIISLIVGVTTWLYRK